MDVGKFIAVFFIVIFIIIIAIQTILKMYAKTAPIARSSVFVVYKNSKNFNQTLGSNFEYRCVLSKSAKKKFGKLSIMGLGDTPKDAYDNASWQLTSYLRKKNNE